MRLIFCHFVGPYLNIDMNPVIEFEEENEEGEEYVVDSEIIYVKKSRI